MQNYRVRLESEVFDSFRCRKAADSLDIDYEKKSIHEFVINADLDAPYNIGLIVGSSGSGKTTLAKKIFGENCFYFEIDESKAVIDQFPPEMNYDQCAEALLGIGLSSVPCWIRPMYTLSNGQRMRALTALQMTKSDDFVVDEWTSVVDRTVGKAMSHCLQRHARKSNRRIVVLSCHHDVIDWLNPDWIIDCNKGIFEDRRLLWRDFKRSEKLNFEIQEIDGSSWKYFSKYHYLSDKLPGGHTKYFGLFHEGEQVGFQCFANYVPHRIGTKAAMQMHCNRIVIHPDYVGFGLGMRFINIMSEIMAARGYDVRSKFSSTPIYKGFCRFADLWKLKSVQRDTPKPGVDMDRKSGFRQHVKTYSFEWVGPQKSV